MGAIVVTRDPSPTQMLYEGAHDAIEALSLVRLALRSHFMPPNVIEMIDNHIAELECAIEAHEKEKGL